MEFLKGIKHVKTFHCSGFSTILGLNGGQGNLSQSAFEQK